MSTPPDRNTVWFSNFPNGRFANAAFQFWFATYLKKKRDYAVIVGHPDRPASDLPWRMFGLENHAQAIDLLPCEPPPAFMQLSLDRSESPESDLLKIDQHFRTHPGTVLTVDGFFQYDTGSMALDPEYRQVFENHLAPTENSKTPFQQAIWRYQQTIRQAFKDSFLVGIHVRRGDYLAYNNDMFYTLNLDQVVTQLQSLLTRDHILNAAVYVATDDPEYCREFFSVNDIQITTSQDFLASESSTAVEHMMLDLAALASVQLMVASNSSFSMLSALMNQQARIFWRQSQQGELVSFDPWNAPVLYGMYRT
jgi:hypothetical protein